MKLIIGLGNPGNSYQTNYHNAGFIVINEYCKRNNVTLSKNDFNGIYQKVELQDQKIILAKPLTYMNNSGEFIFKIANYFGILPKDILIIHDDIDIRVDKFKYKFSGGHGGQNGIKNIIHHLGTNDFMRLRIGIKTKEFHEIKNHVLSNFSKIELKTLLNNEGIYDSINYFLNNSNIDLMNKYNEK